jgi:hypothetical protein
MMPHGGGLLPTIIHTGSCQKTGGCRWKLTATSLIIRWAHGRLIFSCWTQTGAHGGLRLGMIDEKLLPEATTIDSQRIMLINVPERIGENTLWCIA